MAVCPTFRWPLGLIIYPHLHPTRQLAGDLQKIIDQLDLDISLLLRSLDVCLLSFFSFDLHRFAPIRLSFFFFYLTWVVKKRWPAFAGIPFVNLLFYSLDSIFHLLSLLSFLPHNCTAGPYLTSNPPVETE